MKTILITMIAVLSLNTFANGPARIIRSLPLIQSPIPALQEGTERELSHRQIGTILPWAKNAKATLDRVLFGLDGISKREKNRRLLMGITQAVRDSGRKNSGLLMRYVLNRAVAIHQIVCDETDDRVRGTIEIRNRILESSVRMALKFWKNDLELLAKRKVDPVKYKRFALRYSSYLSHMSKSIMDASAQFRIERLNLGFLQWDLYRSANKTKYASEIRDIYEELRYIPQRAYDGKHGDQMSLRKVRQMKRLKNRVIGELK